MFLRFMTCRHDAFPDGTIYHCIKTKKMGALPMSCEYLTTCAFINNTMRMDPFTAAMVKMTYCENNKHECARYLLYQTMDAEDVPDYLWPSDESEAMELLASSSVKVKSSFSNK